MPSPQPFAIDLPADLPADERQRLVLALSQQADVQQMQSKDPSIESIVAVIKAAGEVAGAVGDTASAVVAVAALVKLIKEWRDAARKRGARAPVSARRPNQQPIDLMTASEDELLAWFLEKQV